MTRIHWPVRWLLAPAVGLILTCNSVEELPPMAPDVADKQQGDLTDSRYQAVYAGMAYIHEAIDEMLQGGLQFCHAIAALRNDPGRDDPGDDQVTDTTDTIVTPDTTDRIDTTDVPDTPDTPDTTGTVDSTDQDTDQGKGRGKGKGKKKGDGGDDDDEEGGDDVAGFDSTGALNGAPGMAADTLYYLAEGRVWVRAETGAGPTTRQSIDSLQFIEADSAVQYPDDSRWTGMTLRMYRSLRDPFTGDSLAVHLTLSFSGDLALEGQITGSGSGTVRGLNSDVTVGADGVVLCRETFSLATSISNLQVDFSQYAGNGGCPASGTARNQGMFTSECNRDSLNFSGDWMAQTVFGPSGIAVTVENASTQWIDTVTCSELIAPTRR